MTTVLLIALGWIVLALLVAGFAVLVVKCPVSFGAWEHEPFSPQPSALHSKPSQRPVIIINDLARTGALQLPPQPKSSTMKLILAFVLFASFCSAQEKPAVPGTPKVTLDDTVLMPVYRAPADMAPAGVSTNLIGRFRTITVTNWTDSPVTMTTLLHFTDPIDPNTVTRFEDGIVTEQLLAVFHWKGQEKTAVLETKYLTTIQRSYTIEQRRVYR